MAIGPRSGKASPGLGASQCRFSDWEIAELVVRCQASVVTGSSRLRPACVCWISRDRCMCRRGGYWWEPAVVFAHRPAQSRQKSRWFFRGKVNLAVWKDIGGNRILVLYSPVPGQYVRINANSQGLARVIASGKTRRTKNSSATFPSRAVTGRAAQV